jgi:YVTN family beta-propeller protein
MLLCSYAFMASPVSAAPFAYVANYFSSDVSVIDTATNTVVVQSIPVGYLPHELAITPDGKWVYVANFSSLSVIETNTNTVVASIPVGAYPMDVVITPDGKRAYVTNSDIDGVVSVIDTITNTVVTTIPVGAYPAGVAITPDGKRAYVTFGVIDGVVSVIDTITNTVVTTIPVGAYPENVVITPDGKRAYVIFGDIDVVASVIDTATNTVVTTIPVGPNKRYTTKLSMTPDGKRIYVTGTSKDISVIDTTTNTVVMTIPWKGNYADIAITPDGKWVYVTNLINDVSVIDTLTNTVVMSISLARNPNDLRNQRAPVAVVITPLPTSTTFAAFNVNKLTLGQRHKDLFLLSSFTLGKDSNGIDLKGDTVTLKVGSLTLTIPAGSFRNNNHGLFTFVGEIDKLWVEAVIKPLGNNRYVFQATEYDADLGKIKNPVAVELSIGKDSGTASVKANIQKDDDNRDDSKEHKGKDH